MRRRSLLPFVLLVGGVAGCGASASKGDTTAAELDAWSEQTEAMREHARLVQVEAQLIELQRRLASQARTCQPTPERTASASEPPKTEPLRSEGDFLAEARVAPPPGSTPKKVAVAAPPAPTTPASEQERLLQLLEELHAYGFDLQGGLSLERREALRVLLRRDRQLDLMNPWNDR